MSPTNASRCPFEHINNPELEAEQIAEITDITVKLLDNRYPDPEKLNKFQSEHYPPSIQILRGVHPKSHGCIKGVFIIDPDIDKDLQVGLFAKPGKKYDAIIRFSNAAAVLAPDIDNGKHGSRGMAIKVLDVGGDVLIDDNGAHNQDFLMINQTVFAFANTEDYLRLDRVLLNNNDSPLGFFAPEPPISEEQKPRIERTKQIFGEIQSTPVANPLGIPYFSAAPFLFGSDRAMKFSVVPRVKIPPTQLSTTPYDNYLRETLNTTMRGDEAVIFDFMVQVRSEVNEVDIENASFEWNEKDYRFIKVATVTISAPQIDVDTTESIGHCERLAFTPWHSLVEHQPIGSINRLRKSVYQASAEHRLERKDSFVRLLEKLFKRLFG